MASSDILDQKGELAKKANALAMSTTTARSQDKNKDFGGGGVIRFDMALANGQKEKTFQSDPQFVEGVCYKLLLKVSGNTIKLELERTKLPFLDADTCDIVSFKLVMFKTSRDHVIYSKEDQEFTMDC